MLVKENLLYRKTVPPAYVANKYLSKRVQSCRAPVKPPVVELLNGKKKADIKRGEWAKHTWRNIGNESPAPRPERAKRFVRDMPPNCAPGGSRGFVINAPDAFWSRCPIVSIVKLNRIPQELGLRVDDELFFHFVDC